SRRRRRLHPPSPRLGGQAGEELSTNTHEPHEPVGAFSRLPSASRLIKVRTRKTQKARKDTDEIIRSPRRMIECARSAREGLIHAASESAFPCFLCLSVFSVFKKIQVAQRLPPPQRVRVVRVCSWINNQRDRSADATLLQRNAARGSSCAA